MDHAEAEELRAQLARLQALADNLPAIIAYWDRDERCVFSNRACLDWFKVDPKSMLGRSIVDVLGQDIYALNKPYIDGALRGEQQLFERDVLDAAGCIRHTQASYVPDVRDGLVHGFFVLINDISKHKRVAATELEARIQLQALLDAVPDYISSLDQEGRVLFVNRTTRLPLDSLLGTVVYQHFPEAYRAIAKQAVDAAFEAGRTSTFESVVPVGDNKRWFSCQVTPVLRDGKTTSALLISRDLTERRLMEMQLAAAERLASVGSLAAGVAHEINTPVQFVRDSIEFVREANTEIMAVLGKLLSMHRTTEDQQLSAEAQSAVDDADLDYLVENVPQAIERSLQGLTRVADIVRSLKAFSHLDQKEMAEAQVDLLIDNTLTLAASEYKYVADVVRDYDSSVRVRCHAGSINQVILNLLVNAAHAIGERIADKQELGRITVSTRDEGECVLISISDTGTGIPEHIRSRVFAPFFTTKPMGVGTGQGLAISWTIITQEHRGQIWFDSEAGVGTTFHIRLPKDPERYLPSDLTSGSSAATHRSGPALKASLRLSEARESITSAEPDAQPRTANARGA